MKSVNRDRNLSGTLIFLTLGFVLYILGADDGFTVKNTMTLKELFSHIFKFYLDLIIIGYVFLCLQIAGYLELKHKQDFLTISIVSILFTPFAIFFVYRGEENDL
jgi:L-cystine uptake protein TcyP (sodium:dicarboxylate symporter family)|tara:strand:+ start:42 stop:356 length:315 start_codon:yes stop_codon:yes gene_type:complete